MITVSAPGGPLEGGLFPAQAFAWVYGPPIKNPALKGLNSSSDGRIGATLQAAIALPGPQTQGKPWAETKAPPAPGPVSLFEWSGAAGGGADLKLQSG